MRLRPKNWDSFQHYRDRSPIWIKLHRGLLDDYEFQCLPVASKALAPMLWLLASEDEEGVIDAIPAKIAFRLRMSEADLQEAIKPLTDGGHFEVVHDASKPLADGERTASPEKETETEDKKEKETELPGRPGRGRDYPSGFEKFWKAFDVQKNCPNAKKPDALKAWDETAGLRPPLDALLKAVAAYRAWAAEQSRKQKRDHPIQHPATWLRGEVWQNFRVQETAVIDGTRLRQAWGGRAAPLVDEIGAARFGAWFAGATFMPGPPARIVVAKKFAASWINNSFAMVLERHFGEGCRAEAMEA